MSTRRGGLPGPESRTSLTRPAMSEAEFERRLAASNGAAEPDESGPSVIPVPSMAPAVAFAAEPDPAPAPRATGNSSATRNRAPRAKPAKARRVERMFAIEEDLDKKLWLYAIHVGKDRSEVINDLLRPIVSSMVLYDSRDRRSSRPNDSDTDAGEGG